MAREGTRSQTGNSKPRVFQPIDTAPAIKRTTKPKAPKKTAAAPKGAKPTGVTKKKAPAKEGAAAKKVRVRYLALPPLVVSIWRVSRPLPSLHLVPSLLTYHPRSSRLPRRLRRRPPK